MARLSGALAAVLVGVGLLAGPSQDGSAAAGDVQLALVGTFAAPTYVTAPPGDGTRLFVVEQAGRIRLMKNGGAPTLFLDIASLVRMEGERGLLSMAFAPDYGSSGRFYVYYTSNAVAGRALGDLVIAEYTVSADPDVANPSGRIVLSIPHPRGNHNGGQLQFGPDGYLYIGTGDGGGGGDPDRDGPEPRHAARQAPPHRPSRRRAARRTRFPPDNPFVGQAGRAGRDLVVRAPKPVALLVRPADRRPDGCGRRAERVGGDRLRPRRRRPWPRGSTSAGAVGRGGTPTVRTHAFGVQSARQRTPRRSTSTRIHVAVRSRAATSSAIRRCLSWSAATSTAITARVRCGRLHLQIPDGVGDTDTGLDLASTYSFGEDACGRVYIASGGGEVRRLQIEGAAPPAACAASAPPTPPPPPPGGPPPPPPPAAKPPAICRVPRVIGIRRQPAQARIRRARCRVGRIRRIYSVRRRGIIISQSPRPASRRIRGTRVHFTVSRGRR